MFHGAHFSKNPAVARSWALRRRAERANGLYFGTLTGFHSAPSQPIVSRRREHALDVLEREHGAGNVCVAPRSTLGTFI